MAHTLEVTFKNIENFNNNKFEELINKRYQKHDPPCCQSGKQRLTPNGRSQEETNVDINRTLTSQLVVAKKRRRDISNILCLCQIGACSYLFVYNINNLKWNVANVLRKH